MSERRGIRTRYKNILFRSKLEADWARAFDALGIEWEYEKEGRYFGEMFYLPDFFLPRSRQFVEVKGVFEPNDCRKLQAVCSHISRRPHTGDSVPDLCIVACEPHGVFRGWERGHWSDVSFFEFLNRACRTTVLFQCVKCCGWWFADEAMGWQCQCCGAYDGDHFLANRFMSPLPWPLHPKADDPDPLREAI
jgi:hypothetical protein